MEVSRGFRNGDLHGDRDEQAKKGFPLAVGKSCHLSSQIAQSYMAPVLPPRARATQNLTHEEQWAGST